MSGTGVYYAALWRSPCNSSCGDGGAGGTACATMIRTLERAPSKFHLGGAFDNFHHKLSGSGSQTFHPPCWVTMLRLWKGLDESSDLYSLRALPAVRQVPNFRRGLTTIRLNFSTAFGSHVVSIEFQARNGTDRCGRRRARLCRYLPQWAIWPARDS